MLQDGESSEEDEVLEPTIGKKRDTDGNAVQSTETSKPSTVLISTAMDEEEEEDEPIQGSSTALVPSAATTNAVTVPPQENLENTDKAAASSSYLGVLGGTNYESEEFTEALASVNDDPWDVSSWQVMMEEVLSGHGGERTFPQICLQFLEQFPRAAKTYERLADFYLNEGRVEEAYALLKKGCRDCWNIDLWAYYLDLLKRKFAELQRIPQTEEMQKDRAAAELEFQAAIESMGWSVDAFALWRVYLDFQKVYPEMSALDLAQKTANIRKVFHKAVMMTFEQMDTIWGEFEQFERQQQGDNNPQCEQYLDDWKKKFLHAKSFLRDRRRLTDRLDVDRLAVPPSGSGSSSVQQQEAQQLEMWSTFLSYEMDNFDAANPDAYRPTVHMAFQQCLSCFLHYPEVWIAFAQFEYAQQQARDAKEQDKMLLLDRDIFAKGLLDEAIRHNPQSSILRIALAEIEESVGRVDAVLRILKDMFVAQPDGFTFTIYQRFVRRQAGLVAARKLFSETHALRVALPAEQALQLYLAHATLEWQVNHAVDVSRRCLDLCRDKLGLTVCLRSAAYLSLSVGVLGQLGERDALRWLLTAALEDAASSFSSLTTTMTTTTMSTTTMTTTTQNNSSVFDAEIAQLQRQVDLLEMFLQSELRLNSADRAHLEYLRDRRHVTTMLLDERVSVATGTHVANNNINSSNKGDKDGDKAAVSKLSAKLTSLMSNVHGFGHPLLSSGGGAASSLVASGVAGVAGVANVRRSIFDATFELFERYDTMSSGGVAAVSCSSSGPRTDGDLRDRIRGKSALDPQYHSLQQQQLQLQQLQQLQLQSQSERGDRAHRGGGGVSVTSAGVSQLLKDFAAKLPPHVGVLPDFDAFCRHVRSVVLPPRPNGPAPGSYKASFSSGAGGFSSEGTNNGAENSAMDAEDEAKRSFATVNGNNGEDNDVNGSMAVDEDNDVFRQRHRQQ